MFYFSTYKLLNVKQQIYIIMQVPLMYSYMCKIFQWHLC